MRGTEFTYPIAVGTIAFALGKKVRRGRSPGRRGAPPVSPEPPFPPSSPRREHRRQQRSKQHVWQRARGPCPTDARRRTPRRPRTLPPGQANDAATHRWTVYVRGINNEDLSPIIQKARARGSLLPLLFRPTVVPAVARSGGARQRASRRRGRAVCGAVAPQRPQSYPTLSALAPACTIASRPPCVQVTFNLHVSFNNPTRVIHAPPFELSEEGWGEFELGIVVRGQERARWLLVAAWRTVLCAVGTAQASPSTTTHLPHTQPPPNTQPPTTHTTQPPTTQPINPDPLPAGRPGAECGAAPPPAALRGRGGARHAAAGQQEARH
jgi:hypothetical protein